MINIYKQILLIIFLIFGFNPCVFSMQIADSFVPKKTGRVVDSKLNCVIDTNRYTGSITFTLLDENSKLKTFKLEKMTEDFFNHGKLNNFLNDLDWYKSLDKKNDVLSIYHSDKMFSIDVFYQTIDFHFQPNTYYYRPLGLDFEKIFYKDSHLGFINDPFEFSVVREILEGFSYLNTTNQGSLDKLINALTKDNNVNIAILQKYLPHHGNTIITPESLFREIIRKFVSEHDLRLTLKSLYQRILHYRSDLTGDMTLGEQFNLLANTAYSMPINNFILNEMTNRIMVSYFDDKEKLKENINVDELNLNLDLGLNIAAKGLIKKPNYRIYKEDKKKKAQIKDSLDLAFIAKNGIRAFLKNFKKYNNNLTIDKFATHEILSKFFNRYENPQELKNTLQKFDIPYHYYFYEYIINNEDIHIKEIRDMMIELLNHVK